MIIRTTSLLLASIFLAITTARAGDSACPFPDGSRYCALGDSITRAGLYHSYVNLFHATRFPDRDFSGFNAGISGDTATGALKRLNWDVYPVQPDIVSIMFGMNDAGGSDIYGPDRSGPEIEEKRRQRIVSYESNLRELVKNLKEKGIQPILITPSILDETIRSEATNYPDKNRALGECAEIVKRIAKEQELLVVDFYTPMLELNQKLQAKDPTLSLIGKDRIHPDAPGHFVMAYFFLKDLGAPAEVAKVTLEAKEGTLVEAKNCTVADISVQPEGIQFQYTANALPFPMDDGAKPALEWVPFTDEFNREMLTVTGLTPGSYRLEIDGKSIRSYTAEELAAGVNLAMETETPQYQQALEVLQLFKKRWGAISKLRDMAFVEHGAARELPRPLTLDQVKPKIEAWVATAKGKSYEGFFKKCADSYLANKPSEQDISIEIARLLPEIQAAAIPKSREVILTKSSM